jgi:hypothetical protein
MQNFKMINFNHMIFILNFIFIILFYVTRKQNKIPLTYIYFLFPFYFNPLVFLLLSTHLIFLTIFFSPDRHIQSTDSTSSVHLRPPADSRLVHPPHRLVPASSMAPRIRSTNSSAPSASPGLAEGLGRRDGALDVRAQGACRHGLRLEVGGGRRGAGHELGQAVTGCVDVHLSFCRGSKDRNNGRS